MRCIPQDPVEMPVHRRFEYPPHNQPDISFFQNGGIHHEETQQAFSHPCNRLRYGYDDGRSGVCHWKPNRKLRQIQNLPERKNHLSDYMVFTTFIEFQLLILAKQLAQQLQIRL